MHAKALHPRECCGFLLGQDNHGVLTVSEVWPVQNTAGAEDRYAMTPESVLNAVSAARSRNLDVLGSYHSHPNGQSVPSEIDGQDAVPGMIQVILRSAGDPDFSAWMLSKDGRFEAVTLTTGRS